MAAFTLEECRIADAILREAATMAIGSFVLHDKPIDQVRDGSDPKTLDDIHIFICDALTEKFPGDYVRAQLETGDVWEGRQWEVGVANDCTSRKTKAPVCCIAITLYGKEGGDLIYTGVVRPLLEDMIVAARGRRPVYIDDLRKSDGVKLEPIKSSEDDNFTVALAPLVGPIDSILAFLTKAKSFATHTSIGECATDALFRIALGEMDGYLNLKEDSRKVSGLAKVISKLGGAYNGGPMSGPRHTVPFACGTRKFMTACMNEMAATFHIPDRAPEASKGASRESSGTVA